MYKLGKNSTKNLSTVNKDLQEVVNEAIKVSHIDFSVVCGKLNE